VEDAAKSITPALALIEWIGPLHRPLPPLP
jgi:hypothetical protein